MHDRAGHAVKDFVENPFVGQDRADRHVPAGQRFREQHHVGFDTPVLAREKPAGPAKPGLDFVGDEKGSVFSAKVERVLEIAIVRDGHAFSLNRLDDEGRDCARSNACSNAARSLKGTSKHPGRRGPKPALKF